MAQRVLFIAPQPYFQWRGSPIRVGFNVQALAELGYEVDLLTLPVGEDRQTPGVRVIRVANPFGVKNIPIGPSGHKAVFNALLFFKALALAFQRRYAVIHAVEETAAFAWFVAMLTNARLIFEKHSDPASHKASPLKNLVLAAYRQAEKLSIMTADLVIATGEGLCEQARAVSPRKRVRHIFDIPSSLAEPEPAHVKRLAQELRRHPAEMLAMYVGSFAVYQGIDLMFESMQYVIARHPQVRFVVIGGSADEIRQRTEWLKTRRIDGSVTFLGTVPPDVLPNYLAAADILLSPRIAGINTPLKLLDYLKVGRPIVATDNPANRRILDDTVAMLVDPLPLQFAEAISRLIADEDVRDQMGERGRRLVAEVYNFGEFKRRLGECYREVTSSP
jgi:glycosyltransferase involved in cell wall biosynthesis